MMVCRIVRPATILHKYQCQKKRKEEWIDRRTVSYATHVLVREDAVLMEVGQCAGLVNECGWKTMRVGLVVSEL
jgi:hypothetical protein